MKRCYILAVFIFLFSLLFVACPKVVFNTASPEIKYVQVYDENGNSLEDLTFEVTVDTEKLEDVEISKMSSYKDDDGNVIPTYMLYSKRFAYMLTWREYTLSEVKENTLITVSKDGYKSVTFKHGDYDTYLAEVVLEAE